MNKEDDLTLSSLFKFLPRRASPLSEHSSARKRRHSKSSPLQSSAKGDIVWAKAFPFTWWPAQVKSFKGPLVSISFFGCNKTSSFNSSEIRRFEEAYPRMVKMVGMKLSYEIGLALDEDESLAVKRGFNPREIFGFLHDKAVLPQVVVAGEIATAVRGVKCSPVRFGCL